MKMPNGYGTISKLKGKRRRPYCVRVGCKYVLEDDTIKEKREILGYYATKAEAVTALSEYNRLPYDLAKKMTFAEIYSKWFAEKSKLSDASKFAYSAAYAKCAPIHDIPVADIRLADMQGIVDDYKDMSKASVNNIIVVMHGVYDYAMRYDLVVKDYSKYVKADYAPEKGLHKVFTESEIAAFWDMPQTEMRDITLVLLYTGFRVNELLTMTADNIDLDVQIFTGGNKTKSGKNRTVPMHHRIMPIISQYAKGFSMGYDTYAAALKEFGHTPHDTRHTFISRLQSLGGDRICIQRLVGHASGNVTDKVYTHKDIEELRKTIELLT